MHSPSEAIDIADATGLSDISLDVFRSIMGSFASGVSVITSLDAASRPCGMTCSAVCSVSADPPLLLSCVRTPSSTLEAMRQHGAFAVNFLDTSGQDLSDLFSRKSTSKFANVRWRHSDRVGVPLLEPTIAYAECTVHDLMTAGDHMIVLGRVVGGAVFADRSPLGYWRGNYVGVFAVPDSSEPA